MYFEQQKLFYKIFKKITIAKNKSRLYDLILKRIHFFENTEENMTH